MSRKILIYSISTERGVRRLLNRAAREQAKMLKELNNSLRCTIKLYTAILKLRISPAKISAAIQDSAPCKFASDKVFTVHNYHGSTDSLVLNDLHNCSSDTP